VTAIPSEVWFPAATLVVGIVLKWVLDALQEGRRARAEAESHSTAFQRQSLEKLQEALTELGAGYERAYGLRFESVLDGRERDKRPQLPSDLFERILTAERRVVMIASRIEDKELRDTMKEFKKKGTVATWASSFDRADDAFTEARILADTAITRSGELMRESGGRQRKKDR
jgi:hypothetical protein